MNIRLTITNVKPHLDAWGIDPTTNDGNNALIAKVLEIFPNFQTFGYIKETDTLEVTDMYIPPSRVTEFGEVASIDYPLW